MESQLTTKNRPPEHVCGGVAPSLLWTEPTLGWQAVGPQLAQPQGAFLKSSAGRGLWGPVCREESQMELPRASRALPPTRPATPPRRGPWTSRTGLLHPEDPAGRYIHSFMLGQHARACQERSSLPFHGGVDPAPSSRLGTDLGVMPFLELTFGVAPQKSTSLGQQGSRTPTARNPESAAVGATFSQGLPCQLWLPPSVEGAPLGHISRCWVSCSLLRGRGHLHWGWTAELFEKFI